MARAIAQSVESSTLADILERVLDKGVVLVGDIKIKLVDIELLTIQIRLLVASVDKARELGIDWWRRNPDFHGNGTPGLRDEAVEALRKRVEELERRGG
ncbi:MAG: gas vesicle protein [Planctomycetes bacterium]|nr:gas vesicle protein [Planctomycetota bacterium]